MIVYNVFKRRVLFFFFCVCFSYKSLSAIDDLSVLKSFDEGTVRSVLSEECPFLDIFSFRVVSKGWDNWVAEINDKWIFRFPRKKSVAEKIFRENLLLEAFHSSSPVSIPRYIIKGNRFYFSAYKKIDGVDLSKAIYESMSEGERKLLAETIADFLYSLHTLFSVDEAKALGFPENIWPINWLQYDLKGRLPSADWEAVLDRALEHGKEILRDASFVLGHHDLHGGNMAFNPYEKKIEGIFDFSDAAIGIIYRDFSELISIHYQLSEDVSRRYFSHFFSFEEIESVLWKVGADYQLRKFTCLLCAMEDYDRLRCDRIMKELDDFLENWRFQFKGASSL